MCVFEFKKRIYVICVKIKLHGKPPLKICVALVVTDFQFKKTSNQKLISYKIF